MVKILYVLVSDETDYYYEQFLLSLTSLRLVMPEVPVALLIDDKTEKTLIGKRYEYKKMVNEVKSIVFPEEYSKHYRSRQLKTTMRKHITGDFLFIDCDTIVVEDLSPIESLNVELGAVLEGHGLLSELGSTEYYYNRDKSLGFLSAMTLDKHYNSGVIYCRDTPNVHQFFTQWNEWYLFSSVHGDKQDQPSFNQVNCLMGEPISALPIPWNCQIRYAGAINYLKETKILHYFNGGRVNELYLLASEDSFKSIKLTGVINMNIVEKLKKPTTQFNKQVMLCFTSDYIELDRYKKSKVIRLYNRLIKNKTLTYLYNLIVHYKYS